MEILETINPFLRLIFTAIIIVGALISVKIVSYVLNRIKRFDKNVTLIYALKDLFKYIIYIIAVILIFDVFGIDLQGIFVSIGIVSIIVGFAAKDIISNFMSGFFLISDKSLQVGDIISVNNLKGEILKIGFRNTTIEDNNQSIITIPNSTLAKSPYSKYKKGEKLKTKLEITIPFTINSKELEEKILENISNNPNIKTNPQPTFKSNSITDEGICLNLIFWVKDFNKKEHIKLNIANEIQSYIGDNNE